MGDFRSEQLSDCLRAGDGQCTSSLLKDVLQDPNALRVINDANRMAGPNAIERIDVDPRSSEVYIQHRDRSFYAGQLAYGVDERGYQQQPVERYDPSYDRGQTRPYYEDERYVGTPPFVPPRQQDHTGEIVSGLGGLALGLALGGLGRGRDRHHHHYGGNYSPWMNQRQFVDPRIYQFQQQQHHHRPHWNRNRW